jgi:hypothetical protein
MKYIDVIHDTGRLNMVREKLKIRKFMITDRSIGLFELQIPNMHPSE